MWYKKVSVTETVETLNSSFIGQVLTCTKCNGSGRHITPCRNCGGKGQVTGKQVCPTCHGKARVTRVEEVPCKCAGLELLNSKGQPFKHADCGGTGRLRQTIETACTRCSGEGRLQVTCTCPDCKGTGAFSRPGKAGECHACNGEGVYRCAVDIDSPEGLRLQGLLEGVKPLGTLGELAELTQPAPVAEPEPTPVAEPEPEPVKGPDKAQLEAKLELSRAVAKVRAGLPHGIPEERMIQLMDLTSPADQERLAEILAAC